MIAYDLAREALAGHSSLADFGAMHHAALRQFMMENHADADWINRAEDFYLEGVAVFDMAIHGYQSNVATLQTEVAERRRVEEELRDVTFELARQRDDLDQKVRRRTAEVRHRAEELQSANRRLQHTNREQADFTYALSHDLKTPINTIDMFLQTLLDDFRSDLDDDALELIAIASETAERMKQLIDDVLEYSRVVEDDFKADRVDLNSLARDVIGDAAATIKKVGAEVRCHTMPCVTGSAFQLRMLMSNFLSNALRYRKPGGAPRIELGASEPDASGKAFVWISDDGIGIPEDRRERIFDLFKRLHTFDEIKGSGVGLALCKRVAENHGSEIVIESEPGKGTKFSVALTVCEGPA